MDGDNQTSDATAKITDGLECPDMEDPCKKQAANLSQHEDNLTHVHASQDNISGTPPEPCNCMLQELAGHHHKPK